MRSVVSGMPKCMAPVDGRPFLWYLLEQLRGYEVERVILSVGYMREAVQEWVSEHAEEYPFEFCFAVEDEPLGTGGAVRLAASMADGPELIVLNGDTFFDADLDALAGARRIAGVPVALALKPMKDFDRYGTVVLDPNGTIKAFREKRPCAEGLINGGVYAIDRNSGIFDNQPQKFSFETGVLEPGCADGRLCGIVQDGFFIDIGVPEDYSRACADPWRLRRSGSLKEIVDRADGYDTLLLDRDGVINRLRPGDYVKTWDEFEWLPGVKDALREAVGKFRNIFIVTNQRGVGRGVMSRADLESIHVRMTEGIAAAGGRIDGIYVCTAVSGEDPCRKPNRGLFDEILHEHPDVMPSRTLMVGDSPSDGKFARNCDIAFYMINC